MTTSEQIFFADEFTYAVRAVVFDLS